MEFVKENAAEYTRYVMEEYFHLNKKPLLSILSKNCVWIDPSNALVTGIDDIKKMLANGLFVSSFSIENTRFLTLDYLREDNVVVLGEYLLFSNKKNRKTYACRQRLTACYWKEHGRYCLYHMHISNEWVEEVKDPMDDWDPYHYMHELFVRYGRKKESKITITTESSTHFVNLDMILYIEAIDKSSILHMFDQNVTVNKPIKIMAELFPEYFYRCHRSYIVNCGYVTKIERYTITLITGRILPIPEKRYQEVRETITSIMQQSIMEQKQCKVL